MRARCKRRHGTPRLAWLTICALACAGAACERKEPPRPSAKKLASPLTTSWIKLKPGRYVRGTSAAGVTRAISSRQHRVTLTRHLLIRVTEVTQSEFVTTMGYNPSLHSCGPGCPVENVTWHEAAAFCNALSRATGKPRCYRCEGSGRTVRCQPNPAYATPYVCPGVRLPTEAEWEYAARAGSIVTDRGPAGPRPRKCRQPDSQLDPIAWHCGNSNAGPHPVATRQPNAWRIHDMLGNVAEWCHDWYGEYPQQATKDPIGSHKGRYSRRVTRGGAWNQGAAGIDAASRGRLQPDARNGSVGFRPVRSIP